MVAAADVTAHVATPLITGGAVEFAIVNVTGGDMAMLPAASQAWLETV